MGLDPKVQNVLYEDHWRPMELDFGQEAYSSHFDEFMRHYLTVKSDGEIPKLKAVYEAFKVHADKSEVKEAGVKALVADLQTYSTYYCRMALGKEPDGDLATAFKDLRELKVDVSYPLLLELYRDYHHDKLTRSDFVNAVRLIEAYVFRRAVSAIPTNSHRMTFATFGRSLDKNDYVNSMKVNFLKMPSYRRFPSDGEFKQVLIERELYSFSRLSYMLRRLENYGRKERVSVDEYTVEHILPQNENLSEDWQSALGIDWQRIHQQWVHTLGNLTLTGYNPELGDRPFSEKRDQEGGYKHSPLRLNKGLGWLDSWNEKTIKDRANKLAERAIQIWPTPVVPDNVLVKYEEETSSSSVYSLDDHESLRPGGQMRPIFDAFRKEVMALNPCVNEDILKLYVAYKAETNFVDVVPQKNGLRLSLNMRFHDLHDPKGIAVDVTNVGRWGNGDVEVHLREDKEIPYILGLVRQAFEQQIGDEDMDH